MDTAMAVLCLLAAQQGQSGPIQFPPPGWSLVEARCTSTQPLSAGGSDYDGYLRSWFEVTHVHTGEAAFKGTRFSAVYSGPSMSWFFRADNGVFPMQIVDYQKGDRCFWWVRYGPGGGPEAVTDRLRLDKVMNYYQFLFPMSDRARRHGGPSGLSYPDDAAIEEWVAAIRAVAQASTPERQVRILRVYAGSEHRVVATWSRWLGETLTKDLSQP